MYLTKTELMRMLKISYTTVNRLMLKGLPYFKVGNQVRFEIDEVKTYLKEARNGQRL